MIRYISDGLENAPNILTHIDSIFTQHSEFAPDLMLLSEGNPPSIILDQDIGDRTPVSSSDFLPIAGLDSHRLIETKGEINISATNAGEPWDFDLKVSYILRSDSDKLMKEIIRHFPSLNINLENSKNPVFCAVNRRGDFLDIIGIYLHADFGHGDNEEDMEAINSSVHLMSGLLHESARRKSKFKVTVHQSIIDQIQNEDPSIPLAFLARNDGALEHPMCVAFSKKVCLELNMKEGVEFCLFRDDEFLYITVNSQNTDSFLSRVRLTDMANSNDRINRKQISIALKKGLNLKRDRSGVSFDSLIRKMNEDKKSGAEELFSRVGLTLKLAFSNVFMEKPMQKSGRWKAVHHAEVSLLFDQVIPLLIHLCLARLDPEMRGQIRKENIRKGSRNRPTGRNYRQKSRRLIWGNDLIRYISESDGSIRSRHFVNSHVRRIELKSQETISMYRRRKFPVTIENDIQIGYRMIRGHYRGSGDAPEWDGTYRFGKKPSYYSAKSIRWLKWVEENESVQIRHAEKGGEMRIPLSDGYIQVDGFCPKTNTIYEFHGDVYHGNPEVFSDEETCHPFDKSITARELYDKTIDREAVIRSIGFNLITMWEKNWDLIEKTL
jgi:hypothetical protein